MSGKHVRLLVLAALFTALTTVATMVIQIPSPMSGYVNLGDCMVLLSAWVLGPFVGAAAGGIGSMLADIITGYAYYAPGTLIIKAAMALAAGLIFRAMADGRGGRARPDREAAGRRGGGGRYGVGATLPTRGLSCKTAWGAVASIPGNLVQAAFGLVAAVALAQLLERARVLELAAK